LCKHKEYEKAVKFYELALTKEIPTVKEKNQILKRIRKTKLMINLTNR